MNTERRKVLMVDMMSGANDYGQELCTALARLCTLTVITVENTSIDSRRVGKLHAIFPAFGAPTSKLAKLFGSIRAYVKMITEIIRHRKDIIHVQFFRFHWIDMLIYLTLRPWIRCLVYTAHNALPHEKKPWHQKIYRTWYKSVSHIHVLSEYSKKKIIEFSSVSEKKISVIHHGNYESLFSGNHSKKSKTDLHKKSSPTVTGLIFGQLREYKGVDLLIAASACLPEESRLHFVIAGGGNPDLFASYQRMAAEYGVTPRFSFQCGHLEDKDLITKIVSSDFSIFPYRHIYQSGALMLAMTCGAAIMAADLPGFREYTSDGQDALLCNCDSPEIFAQALLEMENDQLLRQRLRTSARSAATGRYSWENIAANLIELYDECSC